MTHLVEEKIGDVWFKEATFATSEEAEVKITQMLEVEKKANRDRSIRLSRNGLIIETYENKKVVNDE